MSAEFERFLTDLVTLLQDKYNQGLTELQSEAEHDASFTRGANFAYYDTLDIIQSQLVAFGYDPGNIGTIAPVLGKPAQLKDTQ